jgi:hypothetical protein
MQRKQGNTLQTLRAVDDFLDQHAALLPSVVAPAAGQAKLKAQLVQLTARANVQGTSKRAASGLTQRLRELRSVLLDEHMEVIRHVAAADLPHTPELKKLTVVNRGAKIENLLMDADTMASAAVPFTDVLVAGGLEPVFIDNLRQAAANLSEAIGTRVTTRAETGGATKSLKTLDSAARRHIRVLNLLVKKDLKNQQELLNEWALVRRPRKVPVASPAAPVSPVAPAAPTGQAPGVPSTGA